MLIYGYNMVNDYNDNNILVGGIPTPLKNDGVNVSWDDYSIPNWMESHLKKKKHVPNHQPVYKPLLLTIIIDHH